jgi:protein-S-isoprenylcysteine O-methyltransferase Ste14
MTRSQSDPQEANAESKQWLEVCHHADRVFVNRIINRQGERNNMLQTTEQTIVTNEDKLSENGMRTIVPSARVVEWVTKSGIPSTGAEQPVSITKRMTILLYGTFSYFTCLVAFYYAFGWIGNLLVPVTIDSPPRGPIGQAFLVNSLLLALFAIQHSVMARPGFKEWWTQFIPKPAERSTYVLFSCLALFLMFWQWQPMGGVVWSVQNPIGRSLLTGMYVFGWLLVLVVTFLINHFDLFGLRQVWLFARGKEYQPLGFVTPGFYKWVRHPLYVGWLCAFWFTPTMTAAHLLFALATTAYILVAIQLEEKDLTMIHGRAYSNYRKSVPMLVPRFLGERRLG